MEKIAPYRKAIASFLVGLAAFLGVVLPILTDGGVSNSDVIATILAFAGWLGGTAAVYQVPNQVTAGNIKENIEEGLGKRS